MIKENLILDNIIMSIQVKKIIYEKELFNSRLELEISGNDIDYVVINTIRRVAISEVPSLVYKDIEISENTSVFNNNQLKLFIANIPVIGVKNIPTKYKKKKLKDEEAEEDEELEDLLENSNIDLDTETDSIESTSLENMTLYVDYHNKKNEIVSVTTDNCKFYYMGRETTSPYPNPIIIVKLQANQKIKLTAKSVLGNENEDGKHSLVSVCAYNELSDNKFKFFIESRGQLSEFEILERSCNIIIQKLKKLNKMFPDRKLKDGEIKIPKEKHTMGNLISHGLGLLPETKYATYYQKHSLDNEVFIKFGFGKEENVKKLIEKVCKNYEKIFNKLKEKL